MKNNRKFKLIHYILAADLLIVLILILLGFVFIKSHKYENIDGIDEDIAERITVKVVDAGIYHDTKYGGVYIKKSIEDFNNSGFKFGDSVNIKFSNGYELKDIPYFNGYYVDTGKPLLVGYPGYENIKVGINYGDDLWTLANLDETVTCSIYLNQILKYTDTQNMRDLRYPEEQGDIPDEVFTNFRPMNFGNLKENTIYRGVSPVDDTHNRASIADKLIEANNIKYIVNLADTDTEIDIYTQSEFFNSPYYMSLYRDKKVSLLSMNMQYKTDEFIQKLITGLTDMANNDGPYYIHCQEGKDRTGYFCMILGSLGGATYDELVSDYMKTYDNYYGINLEKYKDKYDVIKKNNIDEMISYVAGTEYISELEEANMSEVVSTYLLNAGMEKQTLDTLKAKINKP